MAIEEAKRCAFVHKHGLMKKKSTENMLSKCDPSCYWFIFDWPSP